MLWIMDPGVGLGHEHMSTVARPLTEGVIGVHCIVAHTAVEVKGLNEPDLRNSLELSRNVSLLGSKEFELL